MTWLDDFSAGRAISAIVSADTPDSPDAQKAAAKIRQIGAPAIPKLLGAVGRGNRKVIEELLGALLDDDTLAPFREALCSPRQEAAEAVARVLARSKRYDPNELIDLFADPDCPKSALAQILIRQRRSVRAITVLRALDQADTDGRRALLQVLHEVATPALVPELIRRLPGCDPPVRLELLRTLSRLGGEEARATLLDTALTESYLDLRLAALDGLAEQEQPPPLAPLFQLLRDPDMVLQGKCLEILVRLEHPETTQHAVTLLQDSSESVRRAAVEILNQQPDKSAIEALVAALSDADWWVRARAGDALAATGDPRVAGVLLPLLDRAEPTRRKALLDIVRRTRDESTLDTLIDALRAPSPAIRRGACHALAALDEPRAVKRLLKRLEKPAETSGEMIEALGILGDPRAIFPLMSLLSTSAHGAAVIGALERLADKEHLDAVIEGLKRFGQATSTDRLRSRSLDAINRLRARLTPEAASGIATPSGASAAAPDDAILDLSRTVARDGTMINPLVLKPDDRLAGRYRVIRFVGRGGFGVVVLVEDKIVQEEMILKFLSPHVAQDETIIERFKQEIRYARRITHENVIRIYDLVSFGSTLAISMEYFASHSLATELRKGDGLAIGRGLEVSRAICRGLAVACREGVVHRDLKPGNILLNDADQVKIVDFGLAAAASHGASRLTRSGLLVGTPAYMAPEQIEGGVIDHRTDIYSLGILMYQIFTGWLPYESENTMEVLFRHLDGKPPSPRSRSASIPATLEAIIMKAMALDPAERYQSVEQLHDDLGAVPGSA